MIYIYIYIWYIWYIHISIHAYVYEYIHIVYICMSIYVCLYIYTFSIYIVKAIFTCIVSSYCWFRAAKWKIHYTLQKKKVSRFLCCIFICILNLKREKPKLHFCIHFYLFFNYFLKYCYFYFLSFKIRGLLHTLIFTVYNRLLYIIQLLYITA